MKSYSQFLLTFSFLFGCNQSKKQDREDKEAEKVVREELPVPALQKEEKQLEIPEEDWLILKNGLSVGKFKPIEEPSKGKTVRQSLGTDYPLIVVRIDPEHHKFNLLTRSETEDIQPIDAWVKKYNQILCINAGMFQTDYSTNTGFMKNDKHINNGARTSSYHATFVFNRPEIAKVDTPFADIVDTGKGCKESFSRLDSYHSAIQGLRMLDCNGKNRWNYSYDESDGLVNMWSEASLAIDQQGNVLLIHSRTPYAVKDFNKIISEHPKIRVKQAMHLEGGPEASLYIQHGGKELLAVGSFETGFNRNDRNHQAWEIPNVLCVGNEGGKF